MAKNIAEKVELFHSAFRQGLEVLNGRNLSASNASSAAKVLSDAIRICIKTGREDVKEIVDAALAEVDRNLSARNQP